MALTHFAFGTVSGMSGGVMPAMDTSSVASQGVTPTSSNQQSTVTGSPARNICRVSTDVPVYVSFGASPDATTTGTRFYLPAGAIDNFVVRPSDKVAVVLA